MMVILYLLPTLLATSQKLTHWVYIRLIFFHQIVSDGTNICNLELTLIMLVQEATNMLPRYTLWITLVAAKPSAVPPEGDEILLSFLLPSL